MLQNASPELKSSCVTLRGGAALPYHNPGLRVRALVVKGTHHKIDEIVVDTPVNSQVY